ncbi:acyltransferase, partial [Myxococcus sp. CA039A]|nr:acyltransferase [Myxococcus sp. CA039A]
YALYLLQYPAGEAAMTLERVLSPWVDLNTPLGWLGSVLLLAVPTSVLVHRYVETPLRSRVRKALQPWVDAEGAAGGARTGVSGA